MELKSNILHKILVVSSTYTAQENRKKLSALATYFEVTCATPAHASAFGVSQGASDLDSGRSIKMHYLNTFGSSSSTTRFLFRSLNVLQNASEYKLILVENEPWSFVRWQMWIFKCFHCPASQFGEFSWENVERAGVKGFFSNLAYRAATATASFFIAGNQDAAKILARRGANRILTSPQLGVDASHFFPVSTDTKTALRRRAGIPEGVFLVGFCGRFIAAKGLPTLLSAINKVGCHLALLGSGELEEEIRSMNLPWLTILPPTDHAGVAPFMQMLDLFVLPSITVATASKNWKEQFGHVLIEAMACGVPCLGSDSGAIPEVIADPDCIFPEGDIAKLAERIRRAASDPPWLEAKGATALERVTKNYTHDAVAKEWATFLFSVLDSKK